MGLVIRLAVAVGLTLLILWRSDIGSVAATTRAADWRWLAAACGLVLLDRALMAWRWLLLIAPVATPPPLGAVLRVFFVSSFIGTFLPASVGGDAVRAYGLSQQAVAGGAAVASVAMDRALGVVSVLIVGLTAVLWVTAHVPPGVYWVLLAGGAASLLMAAAIFVDRAAAIVSAVAARLPTAALRRVTARVFEAIRIYRHHHGALAVVLAASIGVQALRVVQGWALGRALGLDVSFAFYCVAIPLCILIMQVPVTINGLGTGQAAFLWTFTPAGVPAPDAVALSLLFIALGLVGNLPGGVLYALGRSRAA
jgi:glycosyltransferase 2 family protein